MTCHTLHIKSAMFLFAIQLKTKFILRTFRVEESSLNQKQYCLSWKMGLEECCPFFDFVWTPFYLAWLCKKGQCTKILFWLITHLSNIFASYIKNLETYFTILIAFEFLPLWIVDWWLKTWRLMIKNWGLGTDNTTDD